METASPRSLGDLLRQSCQKYAEKPAILRHEEGSFKPLFYQDLAIHVRRWCGGLRSLGVRRGDRLCIISENCLEWALLDWACQCLGVVSVPIYPSLPADQAQYIAADCGAEIIACGDAKQLAKFQGKPGLRPLLLRKGGGSLAELAEQAAIFSPEEWNQSIDQANPEDLATIIYTSGTTGLPKGAMLPHRCFVWMNQAVVRNIPVGDTDVFLSFLPLSHVFERANGHFLPISLGATIAYSRGLAGLANDFITIQPTLVLAVPRFLEATMGRILDNVSKQKPIQQKLFNLTLRQAEIARNGGFAPLRGVLDALVGKKIRARVGGHLRFFVSGGAALPPDVYNFYNAFGIRVLQGYGLTETTSGMALNHPDHPTRPDTVGELFEGIECKIAEDGEILLRGPAIMLGYYNLPKETSEAIDPEGWFHTGDIGELNEGYLKITDRKKDIIVTGNGKNIAPQPIENKLRQSRLISEAVLFGDRMDSIVALIVPDYEQLRKAVGHDLTEAQLAADPQARALIKAEVEAVNKGLATFEMVRRHTLLTTGFTIEGGELTPSLKVKRRVVAEKYRDLIQAMA